MKSKMKTARIFLSCMLSLSFLFSVGSLGNVYAFDGNENTNDNTSDNTNGNTKSNAENNTAAQPLEYKTEGLDDYSAYCISDDNYSTCCSEERYDFTVSCEKPFSHVYVVWNSPPAEYALKYDNNTVKAEDDFIHKLISFDSPVKEFEFISEGGGELAEIYLFDSNNFPEFVQKWEQPCEQADIVVLSTHADDEYLMFGGTIPYYAKELGLNVQILYTTTHFHQQPRPHELLNALWHAGVKNYPVFGVVADTWFISSIEEAKQHFDFDKVREWLVEQLRRFKPSVLITHDINGEYGHGAHKMSAQLTMEAVELTANDKEYPDSAEKYGVWDVPKTYLHFWEENAIEMDWEIPLESFGGISAKEAAQECFEFHKSQTIYPELYVGYQAYYDCRQFGLYRTLVGVDEKADFMDHITPLAEITTVPETEPETEPEPATEPVTAPPAVTSGNTETAPDTNTTDNTPSGTAKADPAVLICIAAVAALLIGLTIVIYSRFNKKRKKK